MQIPTGVLSTRQGLSKKLIVGFTALAGAAVVSTIGMASANQAPSQLMGYGGDGDSANVNADIHVQAEANGNNSIVYVVVQPIYNFFSSFTD